MLLVSFFFFFMLGGNEGMGSEQGFFLKLGEILRSLNMSLGDK
jgi:hypothetical protein